MYPVLPRWSPDGKKILFFEFAVSPQKPARIYEIAAEGGSPQLLMANDGRQQLDPNWSPDGRKIVFGSQSNDPSSTIRILDLASHQVSTLPGSEGLYSPRWSPDGRYVAAFSGDSTRILLFHFDTGKWTELAQGNFGWLNLSRDGENIYTLDTKQNAVEGGANPRPEELCHCRTVWWNPGPHPGRFGAAAAQHRESGRLFGGVAEPLTSALLRPFLHRAKIAEFPGTSVPPVA
jgi:dipeptidyl aminopeptidase/acylaminoacyl peptidase